MYTELLTKFTGSGTYGKSPASKNRDTCGFTKVEIDSWRTPSFFGQRKPQ